MFVTYVNSASTRVFDLVCRSLCRTFGQNLSPSSPWAWRPYLPSEATPWTLTERPPRATALQVPNSMVAGVTSRSPIPGQGKTGLLATLCSQALMARLSPPEALQRPLRGLPGRIFMSPQCPFRHLPCLLAPTSHLPHRVSKIRGAHRMDFGPLQAQMAPHPQLYLMQLRSEPRSLGFRRMP